MITVAIIADILQNQIEYCFADSRLDEMVLFLNEDVNKKIKEDAIFKIKVIEESEGLYHSKIYGFPKTKYHSLLAFLNKRVDADQINKELI